HHHTSGSDDDYPRINKDEWLYKMQLLIEDKTNSHKKNIPHVEVIKAYADASNMFLEKAIEENVSAIVIEGMGAGHVPPTWISLIKEAIAQNMIVVVVPRTPQGYPLYNTYG